MSLLIACVLVVREGCVAALGGPPLYCLVPVLVYLLSLYSRWRMRASWSILEPEPLRVDLGLLLIGEVLLLGILLCRPFWIVAVALMSSSVQNYVSFCIFYYP